MARICRERRQSLPDHLLIQSDNTVAQAKNKEVMAVCATWAMLKLFRTVTVNFLTVGHTHEDCDQLLLARQSKKSRVESGAPQLRLTPGLQVRFGCVTSWLLDLVKFRHPEICARQAGGQDGSMAGALRWHSDC